jgi:excisionase family DNA binding protein
MSHAPQIDSPYLTADEAAEYLRFPSTRWFRDSVRRYGIPSLRRGRRIFFTKADLDRFMAATRNDDPRPPTLPDPALAEEPPARHRA